MTVSTNGKFMSSRILVSPGRARRADFVVHAGLLLVLCQEM